MSVSPLCLSVAWSAVDRPGGRAGLPHARLRVGEAARLGCDKRSTAAELVRRLSVLLALLAPRLAAGLA